MLGIPENVETAALLPLGYLADGVRYGPIKRMPVQEVTFWNKWGETRGQSALATCRWADVKLIPVLYDWQRIEADAETRQTLERAT